MEKNRGENCFRFKSGRTDVLGEKKSYLDQNANRGGK